MLDMTNKDHVYLESEFFEFLFQQSFRPRFLGVAEQLHNEGFKVYSLSSLKTKPKKPT
jgi:hypothetical protein